MRDAVVDTEVIRSAVQLACRAPSLHNSQPWRWVSEGSTVQLFVDKDRVLYSTDHSGREALLGCGAVLDHFRVATAAAGWTANVDRFPNPNNPLHLASIDFTPMKFVTEGHRHRADAILLRRTDRLPLAEPPDWASIESQLRSAITADVVRLDVIADELRPELADASQLTESLRLYDTSYHAELSWWTGHYETAEGIPESALVSAAESDRVDVGRNFPVTRNSDRRFEFGQDHSKILVLSTYDDERASGAWVHSGRGVRKGPLPSRGRQILHGTPSDSLYPVGCRRCRRPRRQRTAGRTCPRGGTTATRTRTCRRHMEQ